MKGLIFNEFLEMVEEKFGYEMVDKIISGSNLPNDGAYTSVGTYPHSEMVSLVTNLSKHTKITVPALLENFGQYIFNVFKKNYSRYVECYSNTFELLSNVEDTIHVEVLKLYPEAKLPSIITNVQTDNKMRLLYKSSRGMSDLAKGLIYGCLNHFNEKGEIEEVQIKNDKTEVEFILTMKA
jgi:hypothetical protein